MRFFTLVSIFGVGIFVHYFETRLKNFDNEIKYNPGTVSFFFYNQYIMKVWSTLLATALVLAGVSAQYDDDFSFEYFDDDSE